MKPKTENEIEDEAAVKVKVKLKGKVPEAGIAEVKASGSTGMKKSYPWARMTPLCFNPAAVDEQYGGDLNAPAAVDEYGGDGNAPAAAADEHYGGDLHAPAAVDEYGGDGNAPTAVKTATDKMFDPGKAHPKAEETVKNSGVKRWRLLGG